MSFLLEMSGVSKTYPGVRALKNVRMSLAHGEVHTLVGENGAGKSTLIKIISGVETPDPGASFILKGAPIPADWSPKLSEECGIAVIYQQPTLFPELTVAENLLIGRDGNFISWKSRFARCKDIFARVGADIRPDVPVSSLRMAEKQLIEIARALDREADIIIMDEPTASLPQTDAERLLALIHRLRSEGKGIIYISHRLEEVTALADRVTVLRDGEFQGCLPAAEISRDRLVAMMAGREVAAMYPKEKQTPGDVYLDLQGISNDAYGIRDISLSLRKGEIVGLAGLVGSGRTELARTLFGVSPATAGEMVLNGLPCRIENVADAIEKGLAYLPEDRLEHGVIAQMSIGENITLPSLKKFTRLLTIDESAEDRTAAYMAKELQIKAESIYTPVSQLSGGNQQKTSLARWLATNPSVLILDEPTQGIDVGAKAEVHKIISEMAKRGIAILLISSELPELMAIADRILVMAKGRLVGELDPAKSTQQDVLNLAFQNA